MEELFENELAKKFEDMMENGEELYFEIEELEDIIIYYLELGDVTFAEHAVNYGSRLHPNSPEIKIKKLEVLLEYEQYSDAKKIIDELKDFAAEDIDFLVCCAKYYSDLGNPKKAIEYCQKALQQDEEENFLNNFIADEYLVLQDPFSALKHYKEALRFIPEDEYALENIMFCYNQLKKSKEAIDFLNSYLDKFPFSEAAWFEYGQFYFHRKNYREAIKGYDYLLAVNSNAVSVYANKAACYEAMSRWEEAIEIYEEMLELEYTKTYTYYKMGMCYRELRQPMFALNYFQKALREDPQFYLAMMEQSYIYEAIGKKEEALYFAEEATILNENDVDYLKRLAFLYIDSEHYEESLICLEKLVEVESERFYNWYVYAEILMLLDDYKKAEKILTTALKKHKRAELYYQLSNCHFNLENEKKGKETLQKALELDTSLFYDMKQKYPVLDVK
ncbi:MAG: tetratricopeptide repeat protein [Flavobacteriaceae bacterium]|nr:tetratricopeptide repeat protein [Flavobacteriaceae bacterium]